MPARTRPSPPSPRQPASRSAQPAADGPAPLVALDPAGNPVVLRYDLPEPTSYRGRNVIELDIPPEWFVPSAQRRPLTDEQIRRALVVAKRTGVFDPTLFVNIPSPLDEAERALIMEALAKTDDNEMLRHLYTGARMQLDITWLQPVPAAEGGTSGETIGHYTYTFFPLPQPDQPTLLLIERYRLSSFPVGYGAGRTLKTFSLLPGERTKLRLSTYKRSSETRQQASSILDETSDETERSFEDSVQKEHSDQEATSSNLEYHAEAEAEARWGWGSAKASGGVKGGSTTAREEFTKNLTNTVSHNAARASARREVHVDTSLEVQTETEAEEAIERELANINVSRTLNFVFRQMNQEYLTVLHLVDVRVAFFDGTRASRDEVPLADLDRLLDRYIAEPDRRQQVRQAITAELAAITNYRGEPVAEGLASGHNDQASPAFIQTVTRSDPTTEAEITYLRVNPDYTSTWAAEPTAGPSVEVAGVITAVDTHVMRTDGIVVDAFLGQGDALDDYSTGLQNQSVRERRITNDLQELEAERLRLANQILRDGDTDRAALFQRLFPRQQIVNQIDHAAVNSQGAGIDQRVLAAPVTTRLDES